DLGARVALVALAHAGQVRRAALEGAAEDQVRRLRASPVLGTRDPAADAEGEVAERLDDLAPQVRRDARQVVRAQEHPALADGVRTRDAARGAGGGLVRGGRVG